MGKNIHKEPLTIKVKYHVPIIPIQKISIGDWIDLRAAENVKMERGDARYISLGVSMALPKGYEAIIAPRSSTYNNFGLICASSIGIIDNSYQGEDDIWSFFAMAVRDTEIKVNDRICQFRIIKNQPELNFQEVQVLYGRSRGGYGSTGKR